MNPLIDFDLASFDPLAAQPQPAQQQQQYAQPARGGGGGNLLDFGDFGSQLPSQDTHTESRHDDDDYDRDQDRSRSSRRNKYDDEEEENEDSGDDRRHRRGDSGGSGMQIKLNIGRPGEKRETTRKSADQRVQRSVAGGARASSPLRSSDFRGGSSGKYGDRSEPSDNEDDRYGKHRYDSKPSRSSKYDEPSRSSKYDEPSRSSKYDEPSRSSKYDEYDQPSSRGKYDDDDDFGRGGGSSRNRNKYDDDDEDDNYDRYGRGGSGSGSGRRMEGFGSSSGGRSRGGRDEWDDIGGYGGGGYGMDRPERYHCYRARAWESYTNEITGMEYAVDKTPENRIIFTLEHDGMRVERESDGKTMFYDFNNIAKINHKHGTGDNFLNFLMKDDRMITISTPDTVEIKRKLLEKVKKNAGLRLGNYKSKRGSYSDYY